VANLNAIDAECQISTTTPDLLDPLQQQRSVESNDLTSYESTIQSMMDAAFDDIFFDHDSDMYNITEQVPSLDYSIDCSTITNDSDMSMASQNQLSLSIDKSPVFTDIDRSFDVSTSTTLSYAGADSELWPKEIDSSILVERDIQDSTDVIDPRLLAITNIVSGGIGDMSLEQNVQELESNISQIAETIESTQVLGNNIELTLPIMEFIRKFSTINLYSDSVAQRQAHTFAPELISGSRDYPSPFQRSCKNVDSGCLFVTTTFAALNQHERNCSSTYITKAHRREDDRS